MTQTNAKSAPTTATRSGHTPAARTEADETQKARLGKLRAVSTLLEAVGSPARLEILWLLSERERPAASLYETLGMASPTVSHHLALLRLSGIVEARRDGRTIFYRLTDLGRTLMKAATILTR